MLLILANIAYGGLSVFTFQKRMSDVLIAKWRVVFEDLRTRIEQRGNLSVDILPIIQEVMQIYPDVSDISVVMPDGKIVYSSGANLMGHSLPDSLTRSFRSDAKKKGRHVQKYIQTDQAYYVTLPLRNSGSESFAALMIGLKKLPIHQTTKESVLQNVTVLILTTMIALILLAGGLYCFPVNQIFQIRSKRLSLMFFLLTIGSQVSYSMITLKYLNHLGGEAVFFKEVLLDYATIILISLVITTEILTVASVVLTRSVSHSGSSSSGIYRLIRPDAFIYQTALALPFSFIPLHAEDLYRPFLGLSKEFVMGLPVSMNMLCTTIAFLIGGSWMDRRGWQSLHLWGVLLTAFGALMCGVTHGIVEFILYRGLTGFGYGLTFMSYMGFVYDNTDQKNRTLGFATMSAGMFSGHLCGGTIGGMLAEQIGFSSVFWVSFVMTIPAAIFPYVLMKHTFHHIPASIEPTDQLASIKLTVNFLMNRNIVSMLMLLSIPSSIVFTGILYYVSPIYLDRMNISQANIARLLMINGLSMIYLSPLISAAIDRSSRKKFFLVASGISGSIGLLIFYWIKGIPAIISAIVMISLSTAIGNSAKPVYALQQPITRELGGGKAMGIYRTVDRIGWVLGPLTFGMIMASDNVAAGLSTAGAIYLALTLLFMMVSEKEEI